MAVTYPDHNNSSHTISFHQMCACTNDILGPASPAGPDYEFTFDAIPEGVKFSEKVRCYEGDIERYIKEKKILPVIGRVEAIEKKGQSAILSFGELAQVAIINSKPQNDTTRRFKSQ